METPPFIGGGWMFGAFIIGPGQSLSKPNPFSYCITEPAIHAHLEIYVYVLCSKYVALGRAYKDIESQAQPI